MNVFEQAIQRVRKQVRAGDELTIDASSTLEELGLSSLQVAEIIFGLEEDFNLHIDEERAAEVKTFGDLVLLLNESLGHQMPPWMFAGAREKPGSVMRSGGGDGG